MQVQGEEVLLVTPTQSLVFPAADYLRQLIIDSCHLRNSLAPVVVYGTHIHFIDSTMAKVSSRIEFYRAHNKNRFFTGAIKRD